MIVPVTLTMHQANDLFSDYLCHERRASPRTVKAYYLDIGEFIEFLESKGAPVYSDKVDVNTVRAFLAHLHGRNAPASIGRKLASLRGLFRFLKRRKLVKRNPAQAVHTPRARRGLPSFLHFRMLLLNQVLEKFGSLQNSHGILHYLPMVRNYYWFLIRNYGSCRSPGTWGQIFLANL